MPDPAAPHRPVSQQTAHEALKSRVTGPIHEMSFLRQSLLFAELSMISYMSHDLVSESTADLGFDEVQFFENDGSQAYLFANAEDTVIAFRGTEPNDWNDIRADANAVADVVEAIGRVHRGFKREVDDVWPLIEKVLLQQGNRIWFTGHSLGGAMATICAGQCKLSPLPGNPEALFTFGSPRVGDRRYINFIKLTHYRWVNNNDVVTRVPPRWMGYRHGGREVYLNSAGKIRRLVRWARLRDSWRGFFHTLRHGRLDYLSDHSILEYVKHIAAAVDKAEGRG